MTARKARRKQGNRKSRKMTRCAADAKRQRKSVRRLRAKWREREARKSGA